MSRSERLFDLLQALRRHRRPVSGRILAEETGVSIRTLYRDIASLQAQGAVIEGEPGVGYVLKPGFLLPPLMFSPEEIEALVLGARWVSKHADDLLRAAAVGAIARIASVLPTELRADLETSSLLVWPAPAASGGIDLSVLRRAIRAERKLALIYRDSREASSRRVVWPFALSFFEQVRVVVAWCELRQGFRHFRADRIIEAEMLEDRYPARRQALMKQWRAAEGIPPGDI